MATHCDVAVITAAYNCEKYLEECVRSVQEQTLPPREHIIVDDCSTDGTYEIALRLAAECTKVPVRVMHMPQNRGAAAARNAAIESATTEFLGIMDSDDVALPGWLNAVVPVMLSAGDLVAVGGGCIWMTEDGEPTALILYASPHGDLTEATRRNLDYPIHHPGALLRASAVRAVGGYEASLRSTHDCDLYIGLAYCGRIVNIGAPLSMYRCVRNSLSKRTPDYRDAVLAYLGAKRQMLSAEHPFRDVRPALADHLDRIRSAPRSLPYSEGHYQFILGYALVKGRQRSRAVRAFIRAARYPYRPIRSALLALGTSVYVLPLLFGLTRPARRKLSCWRSARGGPS